MSSELKKKPIPAKELPKIIKMVAKEKWPRLDLSGRRLSFIPDEIGLLKDLRELNLSNNSLREIPEAIANLKSLTTLDISNNPLEALPGVISELANLNYLSLKNTKISDLPTTIISLRRLQELNLEQTPLEIPKEIAGLGTGAILAYIRKKIEASQKQWISKLLVVGEGGVGKTSLLRALRGLDFDPQESTTHGVEIAPLEFPHPDDEDILMQLNAWDFGGQVIYHATHQFFLTDRALYLLVWNARQGWEQGNLHRWLDTIQARAPQSPIIVVATHLDQRDAELPYQELIRQYPQIVGHYAVSNTNPKFTNVLKQRLIQVAAKLPHMGQVWPETWLRSANHIRQLAEKYMATSDFFFRLEMHSVDQGDALILARWLHELGDILYFEDDEDINDTIINKPQWVTDYISRVLESNSVINNLGIFTKDQMNELWSDLPVFLRSHFLRLMEKFDLSYRTLENKEISLVVERLSLDPPYFEDKWGYHIQKPESREITMNYELNTVPPGIPTWFIARSHRFTTYTHWRLGGLFAYESSDLTKAQHVSLVQVFLHDRKLQIRVRGPHPHNFFALIKDGIEVTLARYPGLKIKRLIPCPDENRNNCKHQFSYELLLKRVETKPYIECPECWSEISVSQLLYGIHWSTQYQILNRLEILENTIEKTVQDSYIGMQDEFQQLRELAQRGFTSIYRREQSKIDSHTPNSFVIIPKGGMRWPADILGHQMELHLYCQQPGCWHPTAEGGVYNIFKPSQWLENIGFPFLKGMFNTLKYISPIVGPWIGSFSPEVYKSLLSNQIKLMAELIDKLPELQNLNSYNPSEEFEERIEGSALRALREFLQEKDKNHHWGGLKKILTPEGHYLWLCDYHAKEFSQ